MKTLQEYANEFVDDCLCERTNPSTSVAEHTYIFCGCNISEAFKAGYQRAIEEMEKKNEQRSFKK